MNRRAFLGGLAVATALSSAAAAQATTEAQENAELLALGDIFDRAYARFLEIDDKLPAFQAAYRAVAPSGDGVVFTRVPNYLSRVTGLVHDPACPRYSKWKTPEGEFYYVVQAYYLDDQINAGRIENDRYIKRLRRLAVEFEQDIERAKYSVGLDVVLEQWSMALSDLRETVSSLCELRARTPAGIALKVRATAAYAAIGNNEKLSARMWISEAIWGDLAEEAG
ncbi:hypothetical protein G6M02_00045 [Agrobacterium rhizogenes]|nr:hypothetical protein [Rhizobium rhizogenes]